MRDDSSRLRPSGQRRLTPNARACQQLARHPPPSPNLVIRVRLRALSPDWHALSLALALSQVSHHEIVLRSTDQTCVLPSDIPYSPNKAGMRYSESPDRPCNRRAFYPGIRRLIPCLIIHSQSITAARRVATPGTRSCLPVRLAWRGSAAGLRSFHRVRRSCGTS